MNNLLLFVALACFSCNLNAETETEKYDNIKLEIEDGIIKEGKYTDDTKIYELRIPATVSTIEKNAFFGSKNLTYVYMPFSVFEAGERAFSNCRNLTTVVLGQNLGKISTSMFDGDINLESVYIPNGITEVGRAAFANCHKLEKIYLPDSVEVISDNAFDGCKNLKEVSVFANVEIGNNAFANTDLNDIYIRYDSSRADQYNIAYQTASIIASQLPEQVKNTVKWHYQAVKGALDAKEALKKRRRHSVP